MKRTLVMGLPVIWLVASGLLLVFAANCSLQEKAVNEPAAKQAPNNPGEQRHEDNLRADNSFCYVCHLNYDGEQLTADHEWAEIGCAECHGRSHDHCNDENNITPPEIMYPAAKINPFCMSCHSGTEIDQQDAHRSLLSGVVTQQKYCTKCHGREHRVSVRTVRWNKETGELLEE